MTLCTVCKCPVTNMGRTSLKINEPEIKVLTLNTISNS